MKVLFYLKSGWRQHRLVSCLSCFHKLLNSHQQRESVGIIPPTLCIQCCSSPLGQDRIIVWVQSCTVYTWIRLWRLRKCIVESCYRNCPSVSTLVRSPCYSSIIPVPPGLVSQGCCSQGPQTRWLTKTEIYSLILLTARNLKSRCCQGHSPCEGSRKDSQMSQKFFVVLVAMVYFNSSGKGLSHGTLEQGALVEGLHVLQLLCVAFPCIIFWFVWRFRWSSQPLQVSGMQWIFWVFGQSLERRSRVQMPPWVPECGRTALSESLWPTAWLLFQWWKVWHYARTWGHL